MKESEQDVLNRRVEVKDGRGATKEGTRLYPKGQDRKGGKTSLLVMMFITSKSDACHMSP